MPHLFKSRYEVIEQSPIRFGEIPIGMVDLQIDIFDGVECLQLDNFKNLLTKAAN